MYLNNPSHQLHHILDIEARCGRVVFRLDRGLGGGSLYVGVPMVVRRKKTLAANGMGTVQQVNILKLDDHWIIQSEILLIVM